MKIIIVGLGRAGSSLVQALADEDYDITVVDKNKSVVDAITDKYSVNGVVGSGASRETLLKAGADTADALVTLTHVDEINLMSCLQAKALGTRRTAARLLLPDFVEDIETLKEEYKIDYFVKPKSDIAEEVRKNIGLPGFIKLEGFFGDKVQMANMTVTAESPIVGKSLMEIKTSLKTDVIVCTVLRDDKLFVPDGTFVIQENDGIGVIMGRDSVQDTLEKLGVVRKKAKNVVIVGGGVSGEYLIRYLLEEKKHVTVLEQQIDRCRELMEKYPDAVVSYAEGEVTEVLEEEHVEKADSVVALTNNDETNLVVSMYAWSQNMQSIITCVDNPAHAKLLHKVNMDITVSGAELTVLKMMRFIRYYEVGDAQNEVGKFYTLADGRAEVMEIMANKNFAKLGVEFKEKAFKLKKDVIVGAIVRNDELIIPCGSSKILENDKVIIATSKKNHIRNLNEILA